MNQGRRSALTVLFVVIVCAVAAVAHPALIAGSATHPRTTYRYDGTLANAPKHATPAVAGGVLAASAIDPEQPRAPWSSPSVIGRVVATNSAGTSGGVETTAHGATRIAGAGATRGGVLNEAEIAVVRGSGATYTQNNGAIARILQQADGRFNVVVDDELSEA